MWIHPYNIYRKFVKLFPLCKCKENFQDLEKKYVQFPCAHITIFFELIEQTKCFRVTYQCNQVQNTFKNGFQSFQVKKILMKFEKNAINLFLL